jgi:heat shock protein HtpX
MLDYRAALENNLRKTKFVILSFLFLYFFLGLLYDVIYYIFYSKAYIDGFSFFDILLSYIRFEHIPYFTLSFVIVGIISVMVAFYFHEKISLWGTNYKEIKKSPSNKFKENQLLNIIEELKIASNMKHVPKAFIIEASYMNAFSNGVTEEKSMIVVTSGLLENLTRAELQAVIAHEMTHIQNMDVKLLLFISILSNIMLLVIDLLFNISRFTGIKKTDGNSGLIANIFVIILRITLPLITTLLSLYLSRSREYIADANAVKLTQDNSSLISALTKIEQNYLENEHMDAGEEFRKSSYIYFPRKKKWINFSTNPSLEQRLSALGGKAY